MNEKSLKTIITLRNGNASKLVVLLQINKVILGKVNIFGMSKKALNPNNYRTMKSLRELKFSNDISRKGQ